MALYSVLGPDGNTYNIEGPEGAKEQDVLAAAQNIYNTTQMQQLQQKLQQLQSEPIRPEETSGFGAARAAGFQNLQADLAALAGKTGVMDEKKAEEIIAAKQKEAARVFTPTEDGWLDSPWLKFKELAGGSLPYMAAPVAAGLGALALPAVGLPAAAVGAVGTGLAGLASATQFAGSNLSRQLGEQEGEQSLAKTELAPALAAAPFQAALDIVSLRMVPGLGRIFKSAGKELTEGQLKAIAQRGLVNNMARSGAKTASAEGLTEVGQQVLERAQAGLNITDEKARDEYLDSLIGGAVLGGAIGAPAGIGARGRAQRKLDTAEGAKLAEEEAKKGTLQLTGEGAFVPVALPDGTVAMTREDLAKYEQSQFDKKYEPQTVETSTPEERLLMLTGETPFTPVGLPDGTVAMTREDLVQWEQSQFNAKYAPQPADAEKTVQPDPLQLTGETPFTPVGLPDGTVALTREDLTRYEQSQFDAKYAPQPVTQEEEEVQPDPLQLTDAGVFKPVGLPDGTVAMTREDLAKYEQAQFDAKYAPQPATPEEEVEPAPPPTVITPKMLADIGVKPRAPVYKNILDRDLADPDVRANVSAALRKYASNPLVPQTTKDNIKSFLQSSPFLPIQPKPAGAQNVDTGTPPKPAPKPRASKPPVEVGTPSDETTAATAGATDTEGVPAPKQSGLGATGGRAKPDDAGKVSEQPALEENTPAPVVKKEEEKKSAPVVKEKEAEAEAEAAAEPKAAKAKPAVNPFDAMVNEVQKGIDVPPTWVNKTIYKLEEALDAPVPESVQSMLRAGDLKGALQALASASDGVTKRIVMALVKAVGGTKVNIVEDLRDEAGNKVSGTFDPETNTISLDSKTGLTNHAVLHEMTHAAISHILDNPSHPITKQLNRLYNMVKPLLDTAYGAQNLQEFVAEAWGNPEFRAKLSAMNPDGTPVSAWQKFVNIIKNAFRSMLGMESRGVKSVADEVDSLIEAAISPAPETRYDGSLLALSATGQVNKAFAAMSDTYNKIPYLNDEIKNNLSKFFEGTVAEKAKSLLRSALPVNALGEIAKKYIPMAPMLMKLINLRSGVEARLKALMEPTVKRAQAWAAKQSTDTMTTFNDVVYISTTRGVDPSKPRSAYLDAKGNSKTDKSGNKLVDTWDELQPKWNSLEKNGGQTTYIQMRDAYKKLQDEIGKILEKRINEEFGNDAEKAKAANTLLQKLFKERGNIEPYFPLTRRGSYWLTYNLNGERVEEAFESPRARRMAREEIEATAKTDAEKKALSLEEYRRIASINYRNAPSSSFVGRVLNVLEANDIKGDAQNEIVRMYLDALPENSFAQSFRNRKNTLGFERDAIRAFSTKPYAIARQLANLEYGARFNYLDTQMREHVENGKGSGEAVAMYNELSKHIKYAINPDVPEWSRIATSIGFNMTLGFNISSALVNLTQIPLITMPYLSGKYGLPETSKAIADATRIYAGSKFVDRGRVDILGIKTDMKAMPSMDNYDFSDTNLSDDVREIKTLVETAREYGQLNRSQIYDILDVDKTEGLMTKVNAVSGFVFHHGERMNREVTLIAAYKLEMQRMKNPNKLTADERAMTPAQRERRAAENAIELTELTNGTMSAAAAPSLAQSGIGKVLFMFKRYGVSMYYMLFKTTRDALVGQDQDVKEAARKQIAGIYGAAALLSGVRGVPMFGIAAMIYNMFKDDDEDDFETATRKWMGETAYSGALNGITNLEFASRIGLSDLIFRDQKAPESQTVLLTAMEMMGGPVYGVGKKFERGLKLIGEGNIERGIEQMLPSAFGNGLKSIRYATEGATTLRGDPITGDINAWNVGAQAFGFAPADYTRQQEINAFGKGFERAVVNEQKKLLLNYYMAVRVGDTSEMQDLSERMADFNKRHPSIAITSDTLQKSMRGHAKTAAQKYHGVVFNKRLRPEIMQSIAEFD